MAGNLVQSKLNNLPCSSHHKYKQCSHDLNFRYGKDNIRKRSPYSYHLSRNVRALEQYFDYKFKTIILFGIYNTFHHLFSDGKTGERTGGYLCRSLADFKQ